jgi:hypothetical protein
LLDVILDHVRFVAHQHQRLARHQEA